MAPPKEELSPKVTEEGISVPLIGDPSLRYFVADVPHLRDLTGAEKYDIIKVRRKHEKKDAHIIHCSMYAMLVGRRACRLRYGLLAFGE